ncbi:polysaccharide biosynthesis protein [Candidatus Sumerlaeota bacterium]|nr:polysaccharide biosynthesis protein [Candidatus Sumerlaeota bacterium]
MNEKDLLISRLSRKSLIVLFAKVVNFLALLGAVILLARLLSQSLLGRYQQCWLIINTLVPVLILGAPQGLNYFLPRAETDRERALYCWRFYLLVLSVGFVVLFPVLVFPHLPIRLLGNPRLLSLIQPVGLFIFFLLPSYCLESLLIINERPLLLLIVNFIYAICFLIIHAVFALISSLEMLFLFLVILALAKTSFTFFLTYAIYRTPFELRKVLHLPGLRLLASYAIVLTAIALVDVLTLQIDKYLVIWFYKGKETIFAIYSLGAIEIPLVGIIVGTVSSVVMPEFSRLLRKQDFAQSQLLLRTMVERLNLLLSPLFLYLLFSSFVLIPFLFGDRYRPTVAVFSIYLFLIPLRIFLNHPLLIAGGLQRFALYGRIIDLMVNVSFGLILLPIIGYLGPAVSTVIATYIHKLYQVIVIQRFLNISWRHLYPWRRILKSFAIFLAFAVPEVLLVNLLIHPPILSLSISAVLFFSSGYFVFRAYYRPAQ